MLLRSLLLNLFLAAWCLAQDDEAVPDPLQAVLDKKDQAEKALSEETDKRLKALAESYQQALKGAFDAAQQRGDLGETLAIKAEAERIAGVEADSPIADPESKYPSLESLRSVYEASKAKIKNEQAAQLGQILRAHVEELKSLASDLTQKGELDIALAIKKIYDDIETQLNDPQFTSGMSPGDKPLEVAGDLGAPGRLRSSGMLFTGDAPIPSHLESDTDFVRVWVFEKGWMAQRESGAFVINKYHDTKRQMMLREERNMELFTRGQDPWTMTRGGDLHREFYRGGQSYEVKGSNPDGITGSHTGGILWWRRGDIEVFGSGFTSKRFTVPPKDLFKDAKDAQGAATSVFVLRESGNVEGFNLLTGELVGYPQLTGIVEMEAARDHVVARKADGTVLVAGVSGNNSQHHWSLPDNVPPAIRVRAGQSMTAIQKRDGTWFAWGPDASVTAAVEGAGVATDLDVFAGPTKGYTIWIEPVGP